MDVHSPKQRHYNMSMIRGKNTKPEMILRKYLWSHGYRYRLHRKDLPGKPDIVFPSRKKVIFVHGCFWHKHECRYFKWPSVNAEFWRIKIAESVIRDKRNQEELKNKGWKYIIVWECELRGNSNIDPWTRTVKFLD